MLMCISEFVISPLPQWVSNGNLFTLNCIASGNPPPTILWLLNIEPINMKAGDFVQLNDSLMVLMASEETVSFFTCVADNGVGTSQSTVQVDLLIDRGGVG